MQSKSSDSPYESSYNSVSSQQLQLRTASQNLTLGGILDPLQRSDGFIRSSAYTNPNISQLSALNSDNSLVSARDIGNLNGTKSFKDFVGNNDTQDYYRFNLSKSSHFNLSLTGMASDADVELMRKDGSVITGSAHGSSSNEAINLTSLEAGSYYIRIHQHSKLSGNTNYILRLSTSTPNNLLSTEMSLGTLSGVKTLHGSISNDNTSDIYRFNLQTAKPLHLALTNLSGDANVRLIQDANYNGIIDLDESFSSARWSNLDESLDFAPINAGDYFVQVYQGSGSANYTLGLSTTAISTFLPTETNIGVLSNTRAFQGVINGIDTTDTYRFSLNADNTFNLLLSDLTGDANVQLVRDINSNGIVDPGEVIARSLRGGTSNELIRFSKLEAGSYFIQVYQGSSNVNSGYTLSLSPDSIFNSTYGYGLVNAAAAVAKAIGKPTFADVSNLNGTNWDNDLVNAPEVWAQGLTGQGITVAVIDTGVDIRHPDLKNNIWRNTGEIAGNGIDDDGNGYVDDINGWNFGSGQGNNNVMPGKIGPETGHGTHVSGTIAALNNGYGVTGIAYNAHIMPIKIGDLMSGELLNPASLSNAIRYAVDNGARVINMSLAWIDAPEIQDAFAYAAAHNVITVTAAGNFQQSLPSFPASYATDYGIAVGAVNSSKTIAPFSNRAGINSSMQYVVAPGVNIHSTFPNNTYTNLDGTSMAAPHVAGVVALMLSANPNLTAAQVRQILTSSATSIA